MDNYLGSAKLLGSSLILSMTSESWLLSRVADGDVDGGGVSALVWVMWWPVLVPGPTYISLRLHHETITLLHNLMLTKHLAHSDMSTARYKPHNHTTNRRIRGPWLDGPRDSICIIEDHEPTEQCVSLQCIASLECKNNGLCSHLQIPLCRLASAVPLWDASVLSVTVYHPHKYVGRARGGGGVLIGQMCHRSDGGNVSSYFASL